MLERNENIAIGEKKSIHHDQKRARSPPWAESMSTDLHLELPFRPGESAYTPNAELRTDGFFRASRAIPRALVRSYKMSLSADAFSAFDLPGRSDVPHPSLLASKERDSLNLRRCGVTTKVDMKLFPYLLLIF